MYRTSGAVTEEIVLERRSRSRVRLAWAFGFTALLGSIAAMIEVGMREHGVTTYVAMTIFALGAFLAMFVRTQKLTVVRAGRVLRIRQGRQKESVLVGEVLGVEIDTRGERMHALVFVLRDGRRVPIGEPREFMDHAAADRRTIREALLR